MAKQVKAPAAQPTVAVMAVNATGPVAVKVLQRPNTARAKSVAMAIEFNGKPVADFKAAWEKAAKAQQIHHENSVFTKGVSKSQKANQDFSGWFSWLKRMEIVSVK